MATWADAGQAVSQNPQSGMALAAFWGLSSTPLSWGTGIVVRSMSTADIDADFIARWITDWKNDQATGTISGTLYDGANPVSGATLLLLNRDNNRHFYRTTTTNAQGQYAFSNVRGGTAGKYTVIALDPSPGQTYKIAILDELQP